MAKNGKNFTGLWFVLLLSIVATAGAAWYFHDASARTPQYMTAAVTRGDLTQVVTATGQLNPVVNVQVGSQVSGIIQKLLVDFNSPVKEGQVVAQLDPATYQAVVHQYDADLGSANAILELAQINARRSDELLRKNLVPQAEHDKVMADLHQAEAAVKIKEAGLERARVDLGRCTVYAPIDGIVISRHVDVGQTVSASLSAPTFFVIAKDLAEMQIDANVAEADVGGVKVGQEVEFTVDAFPSRVFKGNVTQIRNAPTMVQNVVTYDTVIEVNNHDLALKPGMTANVGIIIARRHEVLKLPNAALRFRPPEVVVARTNSTGGMAVAARSNSGSKPASGSSGASSSSTRGRQSHRTIYTVSQGNAASQSATGSLVPVQIKTGISDGVFTEIVNGTDEGAIVAVGLSASKGKTTGSQAPKNPFGAKPK